MFTVSDSIKPREMIVGASNIIRETEPSVVTFNPGLTCTCMSLAILTEEVSQVFQAAQHLHSLHGCWFETFFACVDLAGIGVEAAE